MRYRSLAPSGSCGIYTAAHSLFFRFTVCMCMNVWHPRRSVLLCAGYCLETARFANFPYIASNIASNRPHIKVSSMLEYMPLHCCVRLPHPSFQPLPALPLHSQLLTSPRLLPPQPFPLAPLIHLSQSHCRSIPSPRNDLECGSGRDIRRSDVAIIEECSVDHGVGGVGGCSWVPG